MYTIRTSHTEIRVYYNEAQLFANHQMQLLRFHLVRGIHENVHFTNVNLFIISFHLETNLILGAIIQNTILTVVLFSLSVCVCICVEKKKIHLRSYGRAHIHTHIRLTSTLCVISISLKSRKQQQQQIVLNEAANYGKVLFFLLSKRSEHLKR